MAPLPMALRQKPPQQPSRKLQPLVRRPTPLGWTACCGLLSRPWPKRKIMVCVSVRLAVSLLLSASFSLLKTSPALPYCLPQDVEAPHGAYWLADLLPFCCLLCAARAELCS